MLEEWDYIHVFNLDGFHVFNLSLPNQIMFNELFQNQPEVYLSYHSTNYVNTVDFSFNLLFIEFWSTHLFTNINRVK